MRIEPRRASATTRMTAWKSWSLGPIGVDNAAVAAGAGVAAAKDFMRFCFGKRPFQLVDVRMSKTESWTFIFSFAVRLVRVGSSC